MTGGASSSHTKNFICCTAFAMVVINAMNTKPTGRSLKGKGDSAGLARGSERLFKGIFKYAL